MIGIKPGDGQSLCSRVGRCGWMELLRVEWYAWVQDQRNPLHLNLELNLFVLTLFCLKNEIFDYSFWDLSFIAPWAHVLFAPLHPLSLLSTGGVVLTLVLSFISPFFVGISLLYCCVPMDTTNRWEDEDTMNHQWRSPSANELRRCVVMILCGAWTHCKCYYFLFDATANGSATEIKRPKLLNDAMEPFETMPNCKYKKEKIKTMQQNTRETNLEAEVKTGSNINKGAESLRAKLFFFF